MAINIVFFMLNCVNMNFLCHFRILLISLFLHLKYFEFFFYGVFFEMERRNDGNVPYHGQNGMGTRMAWTTMVFVL